MNNLKRLGVALAFTLVLAGSKLSRAGPPILVKYKHRLVLFPI